MTPVSDTGPATAAMIGVLAWLLVALGLYLWYAIALARLFPRIGAASWKGWVPVLNDMEVLVRGGVPGWAVVFAFIPFVNLYYLYLRIVAAHRIGALFGRGAGTTVLAIVLPPLWATLLAVARPVSGAPLEQRVAGYAGQPAGMAPALVPVSHATPVLTPPPAPLEPPAAPQPPTAVVRPAPIAVAPEPSNPPEPSPVIRPAPPSATREPVAGPPVSPVAPAPPPPHSTEPTVPPAPSPSKAGPASRVPDARAVPITASRPLPADDEADETIVVDRRSRIRYVLQVEGGPAIPLTADTVVLGRRPASGAPDVQDVVVPDPTRTLSKVHARLQRDEGGWVITDLESTNGVVIVGDDGGETLLERGASAPATGRFILGKVAMSIREEGTPA